MRGAGARATALLIVLGLTLVGYGLSLRPDHVSSTPVSTVSRTGPTLSQQIEEALVHHPDDPTAMIQLAQELMLSDARAGESALRRIVAAYPRNAPGLVALGEHACRTGRIEECLQLARRAVAANGSYPPAHLLLGKALLADDPAATKAATREWQLAIQADPSSGAAIQATQLIRLYQGK